MARGPHDHGGGAAPGLEPVDRRPDLRAHDPERALGASLRRAAAASGLGLRPGRSRQDDARNGVRPARRRARGPGRAGPLAPLPRERHLRRTRRAGHEARRGLRERSGGTGCREAALERHGAAHRDRSRPGRGQRAPRRARGRRGGRRGLRPGSPLLLGPGVHRSRRAGAADDPHLRGRPLGGRQPARPDPRPRDGRARPAAPLRDAGAPGAARPAGRLGLRLDRLHGADARRARRAARTGADRAQTRDAAIRQKQ